MVLRGLKGEVEGEMRCAISLLPSDLYHPMSGGWARVWQIGVRSALLLWHRQTCRGCRKDVVNGPQASERQKGDCEMFHGAR